MFILNSRRSFFKEKFGKDFGAVFGLIPVVLIHGKESVVDAAKRRCQEELGIKVDLSFFTNFHMRLNSRMLARKRTLLRARW